MTATQSFSPTVPAGPPQVMPRHPFVAARPSHSDEEFAALPPEPLGRLYARLDENGLYVDQSQIPPSVLLTGPGSPAALLTGNATDDGSAISAGTGQKISVATRVDAAKASAITAPYLAGHRGGGSAQGGGFYQGPYPEETVEGFRAAVAAGTKCLNIHVRMLTDGALVCMHDATPDRTTDATGSINVANYNSPAWRRLHVTPSNSTLWPGYGVDWGTQVPPFAEDVIRDLGGKVHLIIEATSGSWQAAGTVGVAVTAMIQKYKLERYTTIVAFNVLELTAAAAGIATMYAPPNFNSANSDVASVTAALAAQGAGASSVAVNGLNTTAPTYTVTSGSTAITLNSGAFDTTIHQGARIYGPGVPSATTVAPATTTTGTLSLPASSSQSSVAGVLNPAPGYIKSFTSAGYQVWAYTLARRSEVAWLQAAGATGFYVDEPVYQAATGPVNKSSQDQTAFGVWPHGLLPADQSRGRGNVAHAGVQLDYAGASGQVWNVYGSLCPIATPTAYTISDTFVYDTLDSDTTRWAGLYVACPDDSVASGIAGTGVGLVDGYTIILRITGQLAVFKNTRSTQASGQVGSSQATQAISAGQSATLSAQVTATQLIINVTVNGTPYGPFTFTDSTFRGGYFHIGKSMSTGTKLVVTHKSVQAA